MVEDADLYLFRESSPGTYAAGQARLTRVNVLSREAAVLFDGEAAAGAHAVRVDGSGLAAGVYMLRLEAAGKVQTRRVTVAR